jgi:hypothetical protein
MNTRHHIARAWMLREVNEPIIAVPSRPNKEDCIERGATRFDQSLIQAALNEQPKVLFVRLDVLDRAASENVRDTELLR